MHIVSHCLVYCSRLSDSLKSANQPHYNDHVVSAYDIAVIECIKLTLNNAFYLFSEEDQKNAVGGFHRVYPFNTLTGARELSPRQMVTETHQMIK